MELSEEDFETLERARHILENPGLTARLSNLIGAPVEAGIRKLPDDLQNLIVNVTRASVRAGLLAMIATLDPDASKDPDPRAYRWMTGLSGAAGGFFGVAALPVELPVSTLLILRSVAELARAEGEDLSRPEAQLACLEVLALGGRSKYDDAADAGYYATRIGLAQSLSAAAQYLGSQGIAHKLATPIAKLISKIATRFSITVTEGVLAKAVPVVGAASGAAINAMFMAHFQDMAWAHFTVRRLERSYGRPMIQRRYELLAHNTRRSDPPQPWS